MELLDINLNTGVWEEVEYAEAENLAEDCEVCLEPRK